MDTWTLTREEDEHKRYATNPFTADFEPYDETSPLSFGSIVVGIQWVS